MATPLLRTPVTVISKHILQNVRARFSKDEPHTPDNEIRRVVFEGAEWGNKFDLEVTREQFDQLELGKTYQLQICEA